MDYLSLQLPLKLYVEFSTHTGDIMDPCPRFANQLEIGFVQIGKVLSFREVVNFDKLGFGN